MNRDEIREALVGMLQEILAAIDDTGEPPFKEPDLLKIAALATAALVALESSKAHPLPDLSEYEALLPLTAIRIVCAAAYDNSPPPGTTIQAIDTIDRWLKDYMSVPTGASPPPVAEKGDEEPREEVESNGEMPAGEYMCRRCKRRIRGVNDRDDIRATACVCGNRCWVPMAEPVGETEADDD